MPKLKFSPGTIVCTQAVNEVCKDNEDVRAFILHALAKHLNGDWGDLSEGDREQNEDALENGDRLFSSYNWDEGFSPGNDNPFEKLWIITEADRSATTVLFPEDYS